MTRYLHMRWLVPLGCVVAAGAIASAAAPAGSTIVCPTGVKPPSPYCTNVPPVARTGHASDETGTSSTLTGIAGPNVRGGDITQYFFKYGTTTSYASQTPTGTVGSCPSGVTPPSPYCNVPKKQRVSADISGLMPCTRYHFQLYANNPDGSAAGGDRTFSTRFAPPLTDVNAPSEVKAGRALQVTFTLQYDTDLVQISIKRSGTVVLGPLTAGTYTVTVRAPERPGIYFLEVSARLSCGKQSVAQVLLVKDHHHHHRFD